MITTLSSIIMLLVAIEMGERISKQRDTIRLMDKCLIYSDRIMDNNGVWDKDGSDCMSDYLNLRQKLDSLSKFHKRYNE